MEIPARADPHLYLLPHPLLRPFIAHYTLLRPYPALGGALNLVPDASGCIVFKRAGGVLQGTYWGATTKTVTVNGHSGPQASLFVEFLPGGAHGLLGLAQKELRDMRVPLDDVLRSPLTQEVERLLQTAAVPRALAEALDKLLLPFLSRAPSSEKLPRLLGEIRRRETLYTVEGAAEAAFYSARQLNRLFQEGLGMSVKTYLRLLRINLAARELCSANLSLTEVAQRAGYYDQSHFIHDFRAVCGVSPSAYRKDRSAFYYEERKF